MFCCVLSYMLHANASVPEHLADAGHARHVLLVPDVELLGHFVKEEDDLPFGGVQRGAHKVRLCTQEVRLTAILRGARARGASPSSRMGDDSWLTSGRPPLLKCRAMSGVTPLKSAMTAVNNSPSAPRANSQSGGGAYALDVT